MNQPHHIIAIGASAGGIEEINSFFDHTPLDGVSYVVVQHLSANYKSQMVELLARHSKMVVEEAQEGMIIQRNQVYLIPSDKFMTISQNRLYLTDKGKGEELRLTINTFFNSLAADLGNKAIGIILSGLGSDGVEGIRSIKNNGGMVIARDPETAEFNSMPANAIATGLVDFVLEPELMPGAIEDYVKYGTLLLPDHKDDETNLIAIIDLINEHSPLDFTDYKKTTILRRTKKRAAYRNFTSLDKYLAFLRANPEEIAELTKEYLISVTSFFRDPEAFEFIQQKILPSIFEKLVPGEELKMWIAGCASGEEVYSLAILIAEQLTGKLAGTIVKLFATDIDSAALSFAGRGIYPSTIAKNVSAERLDKFFVQENDHYRVKTFVRKMVIFAQHDLVKNPPYCNMHFITCRNLLIYMTPVLQKKVFSILLFGLKLNGYLFLGTSENPGPIIKNLEVIHKHWKIYKNIETKKGASFDTFSLPDLSETRLIPSNFSSEKTPSLLTNNLAETIHTSLVDELGYLVVCVNAQNQVVKSYGDTTKYLLNKHFSAELMDLLPKPLVVAFNILSRKVIKANHKESISGIQIKNGVVNTIVTLTIVPMAEKKGAQKLLMAIFSETQTNSLTPNENPFDEKMYHDRYTLDLEEEVQELKEKLGIAYEKLDSSNENLQSFNEELLSANEEMQSTNEEMQSVNEELYTINADYQLKNRELLEINDDLNNYFRSNVNGQLFINNSLQLMKFSPGTVKQINLLQTDIGRPLSNISTNFKFDTIMDDIKNVLADGSLITREIQTNNDRWYQVMTMPYIQRSDQKRTGAIVTFNDITELKKIQQDLDGSNQLLGMAIDSAEMGTWTIDTHSLEFTASARFKEIFGFYPNEEMTYEATIAQIAPQHQTLVVDAVTASIKDGKKCEIEYSLRGFHGGKLRWVRAIGNLTHYKKGKPTYFTGTIIDITAHKQDEIRKNDFIAMVSHELKTPLTSLQAYVQLLASKAKKTEDLASLGMLEKATRQVKKMSALINGFLNISQLETGKIYLNKTVFDISALIKEVVEEFGPNTTTHSIKLLECPQLSILGDRDKISQVLVNMISNAIKYSPNGKNITASCAKIDGRLQVSIQDEGMGIKPEDQEKLFERYHRVESKNTEAISGFGLGLYLSSEIIQRHEGKVWVESEWTKGSTFYFSLPLV